MRVKLVSIFWVYSNHNLGCLFKILICICYRQFSCILRWNKHNSPLKHNTTTEEVAKCAVYLASDLSSGTTGQVLYVDSGYNIVGMCATDLPEGMVNLEDTGRETWLRVKG